MKRRIFITGSDTGVGKTWLTCRSIELLLENKQRAIALKPVACGADANGDFDDLQQLLASQPEQSADAINCYRFSLPAAPAEAAAAEGTCIDPQRLRSWCDDKASGHDICLIEGVGGLLVPLTRDFTVLDWLIGMPDAETWLVASCRLGGINHTLLSYRVLAQAGRAPAHIFVNAPGAAEEGRQHAMIRAMRPLVAKDTKIHSLSFARHAACKELLLAALLGRDTAQ